MWKANRKKKRGMRRTMMEAIQGKRNGEKLPREIQMNLVEITYWGNGKEGKERNRKTNA